MKLVFWNWKMDASGNFKSSYYYGIENNKLNIGYPEKYDKFELNLKDIVIDRIENKV